MWGEQMSEECPKAGSLGRGEGHGLAALCRLARHTWCCMHGCKGDRRSKPGSRIVSNLDAIEAFDRDFNIPKASLPKVNNRQRKLIGGRCNLFDSNLFFFFGTPGTPGTPEKLGEIGPFIYQSPIGKLQAKMMHCRGCPSQLPPDVPLGKLGARYNVHPPSLLASQTPPIRKRKF